MIIDLMRLSESPEFQCDICIIGTGAAGLTIASEMLDTNFKIMLIEGGGLTHEADTQALYDVEVSGLAHPGSTEGRFRIHGGSTTKWAGQALPLTPFDFEKRDWVSHSGWPISFDDLKPYYDRACQFLLVDKMNFDSDLFAYLQITPPEFNASKILYHFSKWSPTPSVRENYLSRIKTSDRCTLLMHANLTKIELSENKQYVQTIEVRTLENNRATVKAKNFILCVGGIETARLLLSNNIGNQYDLVGRYFQDHPSAMIGFLKTSNQKQVQRLFNLFHKKGLKYSTRFTASPKWQYEQQSLNISAGINFVEENSTFQVLKDVYHGLHNRNFNMVLLQKFFQVVKNPGACLSPTIHYLFYGRNYNPNAKFQIGITSEQEPNPESRILLSDHKDALDIPLSNVKWNLTELTRNSIQRFANMLQEEFMRLHIGKIELEHWLEDKSSAWQEYITDQFHHIGTARMHDSASSGVVDCHCRVHGVENFYIGSSAVFPTSGHSNPTLTIIALCMRLADKIKSTGKT